MLLWYTTPAKSAMKKLLVLLLCVAAACAKMAPLYGTQPRRRGSSKTKYIIKLKDDSKLDDITNILDDKYKRMRRSSPVEGKINKVMQAFVADVPRPVLNYIRSLDEVEYVEYDSEGELMAEQRSPSWALDRIDTRSKHAYDDVFKYNEKYLGQGVNIYMLDTGVYSKHREFGGRVTLLDGKEDFHGHGTHCAGLAAGAVHGLARKANIMSLQVCSPNKSYKGRVSCMLSTFLKAIETVMSQKRGVVSISMGFTKSPSVDEAISKLWKAGFVVSTAAGNRNKDPCDTMSPQRIGSVITVGATNRNDGRTYFSNHGKCVDIFAPGLGILSAGTSSETAVAWKSGTSMSCPLVSGAAAVYLSIHPKMTPDQIKKKLMEDSTHGVVRKPGKSANRLLYVNFAKV